MLDIPPGGIQLSDEIKMWTTPKGHFYLHLPTRTYCKGLTRIIGNLPSEDPLIRWIANQGSYDKYQETLDKARQRGTAVHQGIEDLIKGTRLKLSEFRYEAYDCLMSFCNFWEDYKPETVAVEQPMWDLRRKIATKIDWRGGIRPPDKRGKEPGEMLHTVIDWKTSSGIWESAWYQIHEGAWMFNRMPDAYGPVEQVGIVRLGTKHKRGYEYAAQDITVDREQHQRRHKIVTCLLWIEHARDPVWEPTFPKQRPRELQLPDQGVPSNGRS